MRKVKILTLYLYRHRVIRYLFVGGTTFIFQLGLLIGLHGGLKLWLTAASFLSYTIAFLYNFTLTRWWTFSAAENKSLHQHIVPYTILFFCNLLFNVIAVSLLAHIINYAVAQVIVAAIQTSWNYYIYKNVIFTNS